LPISAESKNLCRRKIWLWKDDSSHRKAKPHLENVALGSEILTFIPNRTLAKPYQEAFSSRGVKPQIQTYNGFIQRSLQIFWPIISEKAGFAFPEKPPCFLTIETAQILMARLIESKLEQGYFSALRVPSSRIYNQIMISMHKAAAAEFPFQDYAERMKKSGQEKKVCSRFLIRRRNAVRFQKNLLSNNLWTIHSRSRSFTILAAVKKIPKMA
jgi:hypothetical protein